MSVEAVRLFQSRIAAVREEVAALFANGSNLKEYQDEITSMAGELDTLYHWAQGLPLDDEILPMVEMNDSQAPIWRLIWIRNRFKVIAMVFHRRSPDSLLSVGTIETVAQHIHEATTEFCNTFEAMNETTPFHEWPVVFLSPAQVMAILGVKLYPWLVDGPYPLPEQVGHALIPYHPYHTIRYVHQLIRDLNEIRAGTRTKVACRQTASWFEILLSIDHLHLRPETWQMLINDNDQGLEILREMGGEIAALTWNEEQGEGVIVRLPWAKS